LVPARGLQGRRSCGAGLLSEKAASGLATGDSESVVWGMICLAQWVGPPRRRRLSGLGARAIDTPPRIVTDLALSKIQNFPRQRFCRLRLRKIKAFLGQHCIISQIASCRLEISMVTTRRPFANGMSRCLRPIGFPLLSESSGWNVEYPQDRLCF